MQIVFFFYPLYQNILTILLVTMFEFLQRTWAATPHTEKNAQFQIYPSTSMKAITENIKIKSYKNTCALTSLRALAKKAIWALGIGPRKCCGKRFYDKFKVFSW